MAVSWKQSLVRDLCRFACDIRLLDERFMDTGISFLSWGKSIESIVPLDENGRLTIEYDGKNGFNAVEHYLKDKRECFIIVTDGSCEIRKLENTKVVCLLVGDEVEIQRINLKLKTFSAVDVYAAFEYLLDGMIEEDMMHV